MAENFTPEHFTPGDFTIVTRDIELELTQEQLWELIAAGDGWRAWMVDEADVEVAPGGTGEVAEAGARRHVEVTAVRRGESVHFVWWPAGDEELASSVSLTVDTDATGAAVLRVVEVFPPAATVDPVSASIAWDVRAASMWACCSSPANV